MKLNYILILPFQGDAHGKYQPKDVFGPLDDYVFAPLQGGKNITIQIFSSDDVNKGLRGQAV